MAKLKPWYNVEGVLPREDLRENRPLDASEFAVNLAHIDEGRDTVPKDYSDAGRFFERTLLTKSLLDLASQVARRLSGLMVATSAVFNMATTFGGGKTHSLAALYHLAKGGEAAKRYKGVDAVLQQAQVESIPKAAVAVFVGKEFDSIHGRGEEDEPRRRTPWGDIAWQLGREEAYRVVARHDEEFIEPKGDAIRAFLPKDRPVLILMDEIISYVSTYRSKGYGDRLYNFLDCLGETARGEKNVVVVASIPASELEYTAPDHADEARFKKMLDRLGKAIVMSADAEVNEIIRRRLFEWHGMPDDGKRVASAYAEWAAEHAAELAGFDSDTAYDAFAACYPFHPSVLSVFERKWQSLPRFQRTRGVLRLLALWVSRAYQEEHRRGSGAPLIALGTAPLDDPTFRAALFEQLGSDRLEVPALTDIAGAKAHAARLDREASESIRKARLHQKVATAIFFESNGGQSQAKAEASVPEIKAAVGEPSVNLADVDNVLEGLAGTCYYLNWDRNRYRFGLTPNLNQMLVSRRGAVQAKSIDERVRQETEKVFAERPKDFDVRFSPARPNDVPNRPMLTLVVMGLDTPAGQKRTMDLIESIVRDAGTSGRTFKSALIFAVAGDATAVTDAARNLLAWEDINDDEPTKERLDDAQKRQLETSLRRARSDLKEALWRTYHLLYILDKNNQLKEIELGQRGQINSSMAESLVQVYINDLTRTDELTEVVGANQLLRFWPPAMSEWSTKAVREAFYSSPLLPRLLKADSIKRTIANGVSHGLFGCARKDASGRLQLDRFPRTLDEAEVEIADDVYLLKAEDAKKLLEPPRLARLAIRPEHPVVVVGEQVAFTVSGVDQYGQPIPVPAPQWTATGGAITPQGVFTAGQTAGLHTVQAQAGGVENVGEVRLVTERRPEPAADRGGAGSSTPGARVLRWSGQVPPQKWMNFYTKVLSKYATTPGLKLEVRFEATVDREQAEPKAAETKSNLRELGLDDNLTAS